MSVILAFKAFLKALKDEKGAKKFLEQIESCPAKKEEHSHLRLLALLQHESRLIDFLKEDMTPFSDAQIGAAVRKIHADSAKTLEEFVTLRPVYQEAEGASVSVNMGYDQKKVKLIGKVKGEPPYQGILRHKGWRAHKLSLPPQIVEDDGSIIFPAEVEIK